MLGIFQSLGMPEILIILAVVLLLFGASRIPALARSLGKSVNEFKKGIKEVETDITKEDTTKPESEEKK